MKFVFALIAAVSLPVIAAEPVKKDAAQPKAEMAAPAAETGAIKLSPKDPLPKTVTDLVIIERDPGDATSKAVGKMTPVLVHYTGWLYDPSKPDGKGKQFDTSVGKETPFGFLVGAGRVIKGWDQGVAGMHAKGKRTLIIPASLGYGAAGAGGVIPPNANLIFDVELVQIIGAGAPPAAPK